MITPEDFLLLAEAWVQAGGEADWRSAVSRAYYAAFHQARLLLGDLGFVVPRAALAHGYLWLRLSNCADPLINQAGGDLGDLHRRRNQADYDIHITLSQARAAALVALARQVVRRLAAGQAEPTRTQITTAMRDYERNVLRQVTYQGP